MSKKKNGGVEMYCPKCGFTTYGSGNMTCPKCGIRLKRKTKPRRYKGQKNRGHQKQRRTVVVLRR